MIILGCDSGLRRFGYCIAERTFDNGLVFHELGAWETLPIGTLGKGDDTSARAVKLYRHLRSVADLWRPSAITVEALAFPQGRVRWSVISQLARARGLVDCLAVERRALLYERTPRAVKLAATGKLKATKLEVEEALRERFPSVRRMLDDQPKKFREHAADACAVVLATLDAFAARDEALD